MTDPVPVGEWMVGNHRVQVVAGKRGAVPTKDRIIKVDGVAVTFDDYLAGRDRGTWPDEMVETLRRFFYRNEDAIWPPPRYRGRAMLVEAEEILAADGLEAAKAYVRRTKGRAALAQSRNQGWRGECEACARRADRGYLPSTETKTCIDCYIAWREQVRGTA